MQYSIQDSRQRESLTVGNERGSEVAEGLDSCNLTKIGHKNPLRPESEGATKHKRDNMRTDCEVV